MGYADVPVAELDTRVPKVKEMVRFRFSIRFCLLVMLCFALSLAKTLNGLRVVQRGNASMREISPTFSNEIDWRYDVNHEPFSVAFVEGGIIVYRLVKAPSWVTMFSGFFGHKTNVQITGLSISVSEFDDDNLKSVSGIGTLKKLALEYSSVSDQGLRQLYQLNCLQEIFISLDREANPNITKAGIAELEENLPDCKVVTKGPPLSRYPIW